MPWPNASQDFFAFVSIILLTFNIVITKKTYIDKNIIYVYFLILTQILIQFFHGFFVLKQDFFLSVLYINLFFLSIVNGIYFNKNKDEIIKLTIFFTIIGFISVLIQILQWFSFDGFSFILKSSFLRPSANIGQPNNLATLLFISFFSLLYLYYNKIINIYFFLILDIFFVLGIALTQSRTSWVVFFVLLVLSFTRRDLKLLKVIYINAIIFLFFLLVLPYKNILFKGAGLTLFERAGSDYSRLDIWKQIYLAIIDKPTLGYGWNQTSIAQTKTSLKYPLNLWLEYSHNFFLDLFVWVGIPFGLIIIFLIVRWFFSTFNKIKHTNDLIIFFAIISFFVHCMFEFPFAYAYFLVPIGLFIGIVHKFDNSNIYFNRWFYLFILSWVVFIFIIIIKDYILIKDKIEKYSSEYLFYSKVTPVEYNVRVLDGLDIGVDILYLNDCYVVSKYDFENVKAVFYRYPTNKNLVSYYNYSIYENEKNSKSLDYMKLRYPNFTGKLSDMKCN